MTVTRRALEQVIAALKGREGFRLDEPEPNHRYDRLDVFPAVDDAAVAAFSPAIAGQAGGFLLWSRSTDAAFVADKLVRPVVLHWGGDEIDLQMAFARAGLTVRLERDPAPRRGFHASGTVVLVPDADALRCHLRELLAAFARLRQTGVIALGNAGFTRSDGWSDVAEHGGDDRPAVFWHAQGHERAFDGQGAMIEPLCLYWRGDPERIVAPIVRAGFSVERPADPDVAITVLAGPKIARALPTAAELGAPAPATASAAARATASGALSVLAAFDTPMIKPFVQLAFSPLHADRLITTQGQDLRGFPERSLHVFGLPAGDLLHTVDGLWQPTRVHPLPDGRILLAHLESIDRESHVGVHQWRPGGEPRRILALPLAHVGSVAQIDGDRDGQLLAVALGDSISLRRVGPEDAPPPAPRPRHAPIRRRPAGAVAPPAPAPGPWDEVTRIALRGALAYPMVTLSSDARTLLWTASGDDDPAHLVERDRGRIRWTVPGGRGITAIGFTPADSHAALLRRRADHRRRGPDGDQPDRRELLLLRVADGVRDLPALEAACAGLHAFAAGPRGLWAVATDRATVELRRFPDLAPIGAAELPRDATALAFDANGARLAVGTSKGELVVLAVRGA